MAISAPSVITFPENNEAAAAENPHWGMTPAADPIRGPAVLNFLRSIVDFSLALSSIHSMKR